MAKRIFASFTLLFFLNFIISCYTSEITSSDESVKIFPTSEIVAKKFPEIELKTAERKIPRAKLLRVVGKKVSLLPFPYWDVEILNIDLNEIYFIKLLKKRNNAANGFASGFGWTFMISGTLGALSSRYNKDFETALFMSVGVGLSGGLLGFLIGAASKIGTSTEYEFIKMSDSQKIRALEKIMGY